jgi:hypothetical protein
MKRLAVVVAVFVMVLAGCKKGEEWVIPQASSDIAVTR